MNIDWLSFYGFSVSLMSIFVGVATCAGSWVFYKKLQKKKINTDWFVRGFWRWILGGIILGRIGEMVKNGNTDWLDFFIFWEGVNLTAFYFGMGLIFLVNFFIEKNLALKKLLDLSVPALLISGVIIETGTLLVGGYSAKQTDLWWGIVYQGSWTETINPVHPISIYILIIFGAIWWVSKKYEIIIKKANGRLFKLAISIWMVVKMLSYFLIDGDNFWVIFDIEQIFYLAGLLVMFVWIIIDKENDRKK